MRFLRAVLLGSVAALCGFAQDVRFNFDQNADFSKFKTYKWVQMKEMQLDQLVEQQLQSAFDAELAKKGLSKATGETADLFVALQASISQEKQFTSYSSDFGYGPGWRGGWYGGMGSTTTTGSTSTINIGTVALDMYDPAQKQLVWRGTASKTLDAKAKPEKRQKNMTKAAEKMLKNFPPKAKS